MLSWRPQNSWNACPVAPARGATGLMDATGKATGRWRACGMKSNRALRATACRYSSVRSALEFSGSATPINAVSAPARTGRRGSQRVKPEVKFGRQFIRGMD